MNSFAKQVIVWGAAGTMAYIAWNRPAYDEQGYQTKFLICAGLAAFATVGSIAIGRNSSSGQNNLQNRVNNPQIPPQTQQNQPGQYPQQMQAPVHPLPNQTYNHNAQQYHHNYAPQNNRSQHIHIHHHYPQNAPQRIPPRNP